MNAQKAKIERNLRRRGRVRSRVSGTPERPRLAVHRSILHIYAQVIDDISGKTLAASSTKQLKLKKNNIQSAAQVGSDIAKKVKEAGIVRVVFDKSSYKFHGRVKALADAAREGGLEF